MEFKTKIIGSHNGKAASIIELTVTNFHGDTMTEEVTNLDNTVDVNLLDNLREIIDVLETQNILVQKQNREKRDDIRNNGKL